MRQVQVTRKRRRRKDAEDEPDQDLGPNEVSEAAALWLREHPEA